MNVPSAYPFLMWSVLKLLAEDALDESVRCLKIKRTDDFMSTLVYIQNKLTSGNTFNVLQHRKDV